VPHFAHDALASTPSSEFETLAFAGGGNRCWWQAGALACLLERGWQLPPSLIGTSAGAAMAASCLTIGPEAALSACLKLFAKNQRMFHWNGVRRLKLHFAHQQTYPDWIASIIDASSFQAFRQSRHKLQVAISRPAALLGKTGSIAVASLAYLIDKKISHSIHPRLPRFLGLRQEFLNFDRCISAGDAQSLLLATAAAPPLTHCVSIGGRWAFDGGYTDNAPLPAQTPPQRSRTLVLLTRHYPGRPAFFKLDGRAYRQPSRPVPVSTWDCTAKATIQAAFDLGYEDAMQWNGWCTA
jgi:predicted acylesterase/phospholipase RssA